MQIAEILPQLNLFKEVSKREATEQEKFGEFRKYCFDRAKAQWNHPKPFVIAWGEKTSHLKKLSDWHYMKSTCDDSERRERMKPENEQLKDVWSITFWNSLKVKSDEKR